MATTGIAAAGLAKQIRVNAGIRFAAARWTTTGSTTARFPAPRFPAPRSATARFAAGETPLVVRSMSRLLPLRCAPEAPPPPADAQPSSPDTPPPPQSDAPGPSTSRLKKLWNALKPLGFSLAMLIVAVALGFFSCKEAAWAVYIVTLCEKSEKIHKVLSHLLPVVIAIIKAFW